MAPAPRSPSLSIHQCNRPDPLRASHGQAPPVRCRCRRPAPVARRSGEVSQGKTLLLRSGAAGFTCARVRMIIGRPRPLPGCPTTPAFYPISVRRLRAWPQASSPPRLAATQLLSARGSHHQGPQRTFTSSINAMPGTQKNRSAALRAPIFPDRWPMCQSLTYGAQSPGRA